MRGALKTRQHDLLLHGCDGRGWWEEVAGIGFNGVGLEAALERLVLELLSESAKVWRCFGWCLRREFLGHGVRGCGFDGERDLAGLRVDLEDLDLDDLVLFEFVLDASDAFVSDFRNMDETFDAWCDFDEGTELHEFGDFAADLCAFFEV